MRKLFERTVRTAVTMKLVDLAVQAVDGTKMVANASVNRSYDAEGLRRLLERLESAIADLEAQNEVGEDTTVAHLPEELASKEVLRDQVRQARRSHESEAPQPDQPDRPGGPADEGKAGYRGRLQRPGYGLTCGDGWRSDRHVGHSRGRGGRRK